MKESDTHILILGHPRGGTSLLYNMVCAAWPEFGHAQGEAAATAELALPGDRISKRPVDTTRRGQIVTSAQANGKRLLVVQIIRDPRDTIVSKHLGGGYAATPESYRDRSGREQPALGYLPIFYGLREWSYTHTPLVVVRYENLVQSPLAVQSAIGRMVGREITGLAFPDFHFATHPPMREGERAQPLNGAHIGRWRNPEHADHLRRCFHRNTEMLSAVIDFGYEKDGSWLGSVLEAA
jgi:hypothetical protein